MLKIRAQRYLRPCTPWPRTKGGQLGTKADTLAAFQDNKAVKRLLEYRHWNDLLKMYGKKLTAQLNLETERLHPHFRIAGAVTGRMSASNPNVQGMPKDPEFRRLFVPQEGNVLVCADYNQMQLRIAAILSGDAKLLSAYEKGRDVHRLTAASVLSKKAKDVTDEERSLAKAIGFGILFGMGAKGLRTYALSNYGVSISEGEAQRVRKRFFETYPGVEEWQKTRVQEGEETGCVESPTGRFRNFTNEPKVNVYTASMNTPIQAGEAEVMLAALGCLEDMLGKYDAGIINCVHDEILIECPEKHVEGVKNALRKSMEKGMLDIFPKATLNGLVEVGSGHTWADAK